MSRSIVTALALGLLVGAGCKKKESESTAQQEPPPQTQEVQQPPPEATAGQDAAASAGVQAGGIARDPSEGPAATFATMTGTVEVRRVGETEWTAATADDKLYPGDAVRTAEESTATLVLADESTIEVAEVSTVGIASRDGTADPASAAAVLAGLARFTVTPRTPGEGPFRVYTPSSVIITRGTIYGVGVAASGEARVGVETGAVDVIGLVQLDGTPVAVETTTQVTVAAEGTVGTPEPWPADDWGTWRDERDATIQLGATIEAHGRALAALSQALVDAYAELQAAADAAATFEATAATSAENNDPAAYTAALPEGAATIDASFALGGRLEALTWAHAGHATLATDLYVRHPTEVQAQWHVVAPHVDASVLWPKRYEITANAYFQPLRTQYYVHHPRGRAHAQLVGIAVPEFYAQVEPPQIEPATIRAKVKGPVWTPPELTYKASARPVWVAAPAADWHAKVKVKPAPPRAKVAWYVRPPELKAKAFIGAKVTGNWQSKLTVAAPQPRAALAASWKVPVGMKVKIGPPDLKAAANARVKVKLGPDGRLVRDHRMTAKGQIKGQMTGRVPDIGATAGAKVGIQPPAVNVPAVKGKAGVTVRDHRAAAGGAAVNAAGGVKAQAGAAVNAGAKVKVKAPEVKVKAPSVKIKGEAKGSIKIGN